MKITFAQQAEKFLREGATRKRNPLRPQTLRTYKSQVETHLIPLIGNKRLQDVGNKVVSEIVAKMAEDGLSAGTIKLNICILKKIRKSAVNSEGDQLYPATWNADVIDAPEAAPKQPTVSAQAIQDAISKALADGRPVDAGLYAILAGTGLRIAEARALSLINAPVDTAWLPQQSKIIVRQQITRSGFGPTKTKAGVREVDLAPELNDFLKSIAMGMGDQWMFPDSESYYAKSLKKDGIQGGFHVFRRFRVTHLRMSGAPQPLIDFWDGHAASTMSERYTQVAGEIESRKQWAAKVGLGFQLPETVTIHDETIIHEPETAQ